MLCCRTNKDILEIDEIGIEGNFNNMCVLDGEKEVNNHTESICNGKTSNNKISPISESSEIAIPTPKTRRKSCTKQKLLDFIRNDVIGSNVSFEGPFGCRNLIYCDFTASGRSLKFIEDYISNYVYPYYGNTHTTMSVASRQTTLFRDEAREIIKECVNASQDDVVIYAGSGTTGAIHKLLAGLELTNADKAASTVVLFGPFEHHSNILPWKETGAKIMRIKETLSGHVDIDDIESKLQNCDESVTLKIVTCSAASNVTGILTDTDAVSAMAHKYGAYAIFDYASAAPYIKIDMNRGSDIYKDAIVCSPHKFVGGPGTPGLLIAKRHMFSNTVPSFGGGGTVLYVTRDTYAYIKDIESREEGGTPAIVESIRCGMVFQLKEAIGPEVIETREEYLCRRAFERWSKHPNIIILGSHSAKRLPIFSLVIKHSTSGKYLHHNYVSVVLNDVFGIQSRGGCACAGPYAEDLLGIAENLAQNFTKFLSGNESEIGLNSPLEIMKPGFCRLNFPYFMDDQTVDYVLDAVEMAASDAWRLLPQYVNDPQTGVWKHRSVTCVDDDTHYSLRDIDYDQPNFGLHESVYRHVPKIKFKPKKMLSLARNIFQKAKMTSYEENSICENIDSHLDEIQRRLIWFIQPKQAWKLLKSETVMKLNQSILNRQRSAVPFKPRHFTTRRVISSLRSKGSFTSNTSKV